MRRLGAFVACALAAGCATSDPRAFARVDSNQLRLGGVCVTDVGDVYAETETGERHEVVKLDAAGHPLWRRTLGSTRARDQSVFGLCADGGVTSVTFRSGSAHVTRLASSGDPVLRADLPVPEGRVVLRALAAGAAGRIYAGGHVSAASGVRAPLLFRIDRSGAAVEVSLALAELESVDHLDALADGIVVAGRSHRSYFVAALDELDRVRWSLVGRDVPLGSPIEGMVSDPSGVYLCGARSFTVHVALVDPDGVWSWHDELEGEKAPLFAPCLVRRRVREGAFLVTEPWSGSGRGGSALLLRPVDTGGVADPAVEVPYAGDVAPNVDVSTSPETLFLGGTPTYLDPSSPRAREKSVTRVPLP